MLRPFFGRSPSYDDSNFIAPSAELIGDVTLGTHSSVWFNVTIRADVNWIRIGSCSNIQDNAVVHVTKKRAPTLIGDYVTVAHGAVIHGCTIEDNVLVAMGAVVLDQSVIGKNSLVGAGALVTERTEIPPGSLVLGSPARVVRKISDQEVARIRQNADNYRQYTRIYLGREIHDENPFY